MISEGKNFPDLAAFYRKRFVEPTHELLRGILRRGIEGGEFAPVDLSQAVHTVLAPWYFSCSANSASAFRSMRTA